MWLASCLACGLGFVSTFGSLFLKLLIKSPDFAALMTKAVNMSYLADLFIWREVRDEARQRAEARRF